MKNRVNLNISIFGGSKNAVIKLEASLSSMDLLERPYFTHIPELLNLKVRENGPALCVIEISPEVPDSC